MSSRLLGAREFQTPSTVTRVAIMRGLTRLKPIHSCSEDLERQLSHLAPFPPAHVAEPSSQPEIQPPDELWTDAQGNGYREMSMEHVESMNDDELQVIFQSIAP